MDGAGTRDDDAVRQVALVRGGVQGVGFRWWVRAQARELGLDGSARNMPDGRVEVVAQGGPDAVRELLGRLHRDDVPGRPGRVSGIEAHDPVPPEQTGGGFTVD